MASLKDVLAVLLGKRGPSACCDMKIEEVGELTDGMHYSPRLTVTDGSSIAGDAPRAKQSDSGGLDKAV